MKRRVWLFFCLATAGCASRSTPCEKDRALEDAAVTEREYRAIVAKGVLKESFKPGTPEEMKYWDETLKTWPGPISKAEERALRDGYLWKDMEEGFAFMQLDRWYRGVRFAQTDHPGYQVFIMQGSLDSFVIDREKHVLTTWTIHQ